MPEGYIRGKPDPTWWITQIRAGEEFRKRLTHQHRWDAWRSYYRGNFSPRTMPTSVFFTMLRQVVPRTYFSDPTVSITPTMPGHLNMAFALVVGRIDNKMISQMKMKRQMKRIVHNAALFGTGVGKLGFGAKFNVASDRDEAEAPIPQGNLIEYDPFVISNQPWFRSVHTSNFVVPDQLMDFQDARWIAEKMDRPVEDLKADPRFKTPANLPTTSWSTSGKFSVQHRVEMATVYEIRDIKTQRVFVLAPNADSDGQILLDKPDIAREGIGFNYFPVQFNQDDEFFWAVPDSKHLEYLQLELNEVNTQIMKHRRLSLTRFLSKVGTITEAEKQRMLSEDTQAWVDTLQDPNSIIQLNVSNSDALNQLIVSRNTIIEQIRELMGFSRNQLGDFQSRRGDTSATEAAAVQAGGEVRIDEKRDALADMFVDAIEHMNATMFTNWEQEKVVQVVGPGGAEVWVKFDPELLKAGRYAIRVDPDSMAPKDRAARANNAVQIYNILQTNPTIDPIKMTRYLLTEVGGVELDDLMHALPPITSDIPDQNNPIGMGGLADMITRGVQQAQSGQRNPALPGRA